MGALIELDEVEKTFTVRHKAGRIRRRKAEVRAVDSVSCEIPAGSMVGYIGPNGECRMLQPCLTSRNSTRPYFGGGSLVVGQGTRA